MATAVNASFTTGKTVYYIITNPNELYWNGSNFESYNSADWSLYAITMTEGPPEEYTGYFPSAITVAAIYTLWGYNQLGIDPSPDDPNVLLGGMAWNGSSESQGSGIDSEFEMGVKEPTNINIRTGITGVCC